MILHSSTARGTNITFITQASVDVAHRCSPSSLHSPRSCSPKQARRPFVLMEYTGRDAWDRMGLWECASHIRTVTVIGTIVRLVAPTVRTGRGVLDPMYC